MSRLHNAAITLCAAMTELAVEYGTETAEINVYDKWYLGSPYENLDEFLCTRLYGLTDGTPELSWGPAPEMICL